MFVRLLYLRVLRLLAAVVLLSWGDAAKTAEILVATPRERGTAPTVANAKRLAAITRPPSHARGNFWLSSAATS
ncbi:MAG: hypothetical protein JWR24_1869 [Actinoallomurus sp.]|jgi:hypothetical protein|nr:hypothetical protein [Actinoallomurus sp.]